MSTTDPWVENAAPTGRWPRLRLGEPWEHRELIYFFALRDVKVRYKQALFGVGWAIVQPLAGALIFTLVFHGIADLDVGKGQLYFVFAFVGFVVWSYFSTAISNGTSSLLVNGELLTKVPFPKIAAPTAALLPGLVDLAVGIVAGLVISIGWGGGPSPVGLLVGLPAGLILLIVAAAGPALLLSASIVKYRDVAILVTFGLQLLLFASPVAYPPETVPAAWRPLQFVNPLAGSLDLLRWALADIPLTEPGLLAISFTSAALLLVAGFAYFRRREANLVDIL